MRSPLHERIERGLARREEAGLLREIPEPREEDSDDFIDLSTNSYLALHRNKKVAAAARRLAGPMRLCGNLASRLVSETSPLYKDLEAELASWKGSEAALLFNSGYAANLGILQALTTRDTEVFCDRFNHASIIDGIRLAGCRLSRYRHCDMGDLKARLAASSARERLIVTDTVFSMDGDCAPLSDICELAESYGCVVMADEAHAAGIFGKRGGGLAEAMGVADGIDIRMGTLSKAVAGVGGFFAGSKLIRDYLVNHARSLIYSTGLPHAAIAFDLAAVRHILLHQGAGARLLESARRFRRNLAAEGFDTLSSTTQIVPVVVGEDAAAVSLQRFLWERGIVAPAIRPPTVPAGTARIRFSLSDGLTPGQMDAVITALSEWRKRHG